MINYFIISGNQNVTESIKKLLYYERKFAKTFYHIEELRDFISVDDYGVLYIVESNSYDLYEVSGDISLEYPNLKVILIDKLENIDYKKAMYVGATDIINVDFSEEEWKQALVKAESIIEMKMEDFEKKSDKKQGRIITVASTKGGIGKTTLSVNLGVSLAQRNVKVVIVDLDLQFGDVPLLLDLQPKQTIYEWLKESYENGDGKVTPYLTSDKKSNITILSAPTLPEFAELITGEHITNIFNQLQKDFDVIIVDTPPSFVETSLVALENADDILLITSLDLPSLKNGKLAMDTFKLLEFKDKVKIILNRETPMDGMDAETVESILGQKMEASIPSDYKTVISSINLGVPFVLGASKTAVAKGVEKLINQLMTEKEPKKKKDKKRFAFRRKKNNKL
ncbi:AAA family ATPase [Salirhabdus sp. Marseille-P4669]|uniref:AAA family ATPase n=1 Tax=Salirhabdus sp. Marseille-P4669 TaxID=2042310 RepID=UPI000C7CC751|nr:AAA family ATPase [Salirhabdus sp. Marseille-P4669]